MDSAEPILSNDDLPLVGCLPGSPGALALRNRSQQLAMQTQPFRDTWEVMASDSMNIFVHGDREPPNDDEFVANWIQGNIIGEMSGDPPRPSLKAGRTHYPTEYWWIGPQDVGIQLGLSGPNVSPWTDPITNQVLSPTQLDPKIGALIAKSADSGLPLKGIQIDGDWIESIDRQATEEFWQDVLDLQWDKQDVWMDQYTDDARLAAKVVGWCIWPLDWDNDLKQVIVRTLPVMQVHTDLQPRLKQMQWIQYDMRITAYEAMKLYPDLAETIDDKSKKGTIPTRLDTNSRFGQTEERIEYAPSVTMRIMYMRNQQIPMSPDHAIQSGQIEQRMVPDGEAGQSDGGNAQQGGGESSGPAGGRGEDLGSSDEQGVSGVEGQQPIAPQIPMRPGFFLPNTNIELPPPAHDDTGNLVAHPQWPMRLCTRETTFIEQAMVRDREDPYPFFPFAHNVNIQVPLRPQGLGEPYRQYCLQFADNKLVGAAIRSAERFAEVREDIPQSVADASPLESKEGKFGGQRIWENNVYNQFQGKMGTITPAPPMPDQLPQTHDLITALSDRISGHPEVQQGLTPPGVTANVAIQSLQASAQQVNEWKEKNLQQFVQQLATMQHYCDIWYMDVASLSKLVGDYPPHVIERYIAWGQALNWTVKVDSAGQDHMTSQDQQEVRANYQAGLIAKPIAQSKLGIDVHANRIAETAQAEAQQAMMQPPAAPMPMQRPA